MLIDALSRSYLIGNKNILDFIPVINGGSIEDNAIIGKKNVIYSRTTPSHLNPFYL